MDRRPLTEIGVSALIGLICVVFIIQALALPPGRFEPLGSGPVPKWTAVVVLVCSLLVMVSAARSMRGTTIADAMRREFTGGHPIGGAIMMGLTVAYVAALHLKLAGFGMITFVYLLLLILGMEGFSRRRFVPAIVVAAVAAFGAQYIFTQVFVVDLPV
ncbi:MAG: tripartite tricarboxylate transporter TctB family protein [Pseudomonadota bacterium]